MDNFKILIKQSAQKEIESVGTKKDRQRIVRSISNLTENPRPPGNEKISGSPYYRLRQGHYRVIYEIQENQRVIHVMKVGHRKDVYRLNL